jgi:hypothetical protein
MPDLITLPAALAQFDRKERRLVIEKCLGHQAARSVDCQFLREIAAAGIRLNERCTWFADYHIDWLVGAVWLFQMGGQFQPQSGVSVRRDNSDQLVRGSQQDIDLLLADETPLVCVEAKWFESWELETLRDKVGRVLGAIKKARQAPSSGNRQLDLHFLLMSVRDPKPYVDALMTCIPDASIHPLQISAGHRPKRLLTIGRINENWQIRAAPKLSPSHSSKRAIRPCGTGRSGTS